MSLKLEAQTMAGTIVEYHASTKSAEARLQDLINHQKVMSSSITEVVDHAEIVEQPTLTQQQYSEIKE
jgi:hypothetical protein